MATKAMLILALVVGCIETGVAAPVMTAFVPLKDGFKFVNDFVNDFVPALDIRTGGLCGGMSYAAFDYYNAHEPIPNQDYRPANRTTLQSYLYSRQVDSTTGNLDKWAEIDLTAIKVTL